MEQIMRRSLTWMIGLTLVAVIPLGCGREERRNSPSLGEQRLALRGAPGPLARLHADSNDLLEGGLPAFTKRLRTLRGYPVVVNVWGSWCPPCREELPYLQALALEHGKEVAFIGVDANEDPLTAARELLQEVPVSFPSYRDPNNEITEELLGTLAFPSTVFYDRGGERAYIHFGKYRSERDLAADLERYAKSVPRAGSE